jgi:hypothetical protein
MAGRVVMKKSLIIQYVNLLHKYGDCARVAAFVDLHKDDKVFVRRAHTFRRLFVVPGKQAGMLRHLMVDAKGVTPEEVCREVGIPEEEFSLVMDCVRPLSPENIEKLAEYFKVSPKVFSF